MDITTKAVALRATDYKENDKMVLLYSLEYGKISVHVKGVRKSSAKLKFACDQFCFGQYELVQIGDRFTLKTCFQQESFYSLREDVVVYYSACTLAECLITCTEEGQSDPKIFVIFLKALEQLSNGVEPLSVTLKFVLDFLNLSGVKPDFSRCCGCGDKTTKLWWSFQRGGAVCANCREVDNIAVGSGVVAACNLLDGLPYEKLQNVSVPTSVVKDALNLFQKFFSYNFLPLKSLSELLRLV